jgi:MFS family permease
MAVTALLGIAINAGYIFVAPFTRVVGLARAAPFFAAYSATSVLIRLFGRRTLDVLGPHRVSVPGFLAYGTALMGLSALPSAHRDGYATLVLVLAGVGCGLGHGSLFPVLNALALARAPDRPAGRGGRLHTAAIDAAPSSACRSAGCSPSVRLSRDVRDDRACMRRRDRAHGEDARRAGRGMG